MKSGLNVASPCVYIVLSRATTGFFWVIATLTSSDTLTNGLLGST